MYWLWDRFWDLVLVTLWVILFGILGMFIVFLVLAGWIELLYLRSMRW